MSNRIERYERYNKKIARLEVMNKLFKKEIQLKEEKIRPYKLDFIRVSNQDAQNRISTYTNNSFTYDK